MELGLGRAAAILSLPDGWTVAYKLIWNNVGLVMNARMISESVTRRRNPKRSNGGTAKFVPTVGFGSRKFIGAYAPGGAYGPAFPMGAGWGEMSSVPGGDCGDGLVAADASGAMEAVDGVKTDDEDLMISDRDRLVYALRGIIENAKVAYEAVTGVPYDESDDVLDGNVEYSVDSDNDDVDDVDDDVGDDN